MNRKKSLLAKFTQPGDSAANTATAAPVSTPAESTQSRDELRHKAEKSAKPVQRQQTSKEKIEAMKKKVEDAVAARRQAKEIAAKKQTDEAAAAQRCVRIETICIVLRDMQIMNFHSLLFDSMLMGRRKRAPPQSIQKQVRY